MLKSVDEQPLLRAQWAETPVGTVLGVLCRIAEIGHGAVEPWRCSTTAPDPVSLLAGEL